MVRGTHPAPANARSWAARVDAWVGRFGLVAIVVGFVLLSFWYSLAVPPFETPDELYHYGYIQHLARGNGLPVQNAGLTGPWQHTGSHAPLYYILAGRLTSWIDQSDFEAIAITNPRSNMGDPLYPGNKNRMLYSAADLPLQGANLGLHVARWFSILLGVVTLWCVSQTARFAFAPGDRRALLPPLLLAVIPQFVFISGSASNDNMVIAACAMGVLWLAYLLSAAGERPIRMVEWVVLGVLLGVAALSKLQGLALFALAAGVGIGVAVRRRDWRVPLVAALPVALPALAIAGWWYWRNYTLYGDWFGLNYLLTINGQRTEPLEWGDWWHEFRGLRYSFWGLFGWFNILLPRWIYHVLDGVTLVAIGGIVVRIGQRLLRPEAAPADGQTATIRWIRGMLLAWVLLSMAAVLYFVLRATGSQGRLLFAAIGAVLTLLVVGVDVWLKLLPRIARRGTWALLVLLLAGATLYTGAVLFPRSYAAPASPTTLPDTAQPVDITYAGLNDDVIRLRGVELPTGRYTAGESVPVTLYLSTPTPPSFDYELFIQLLDEAGNVLGNVTTHTGWGRYPTSLWEPGRLYADTYAVLVSQRIDPRAPVLARIYTGFIDPRDSNQDLSPVAAYNAQGDEVIPVVGTVTLVPWTQPQPGEYGLTPQAVDFGGVLALVGSSVTVDTPVTVAPGDTVTTTLLWEAQAAPTTDYTTFVHLLDADGNWVAGYDQAPGGRRFPTHAWQPGDRTVSELPIVLPPDLAAGEYTLWVGVYDAASAGAERLTVNAVDHPVAHNMAQVGTVQVVRP